MSSYSSSSEFDRVLRTANVLEFISQVAESDYNTFGGQMFQSSHASLELSTSSHRELLESAYSQGRLSALVALDYVRAVHRALTVSPILTYSVWAAGRGVLEACSKGLWMLDGSIDPTERIIRSLNVRLKEIKDAQTYRRNLLKSVGVESAAISQEIVDGDKRVSHLRSQASSVGIRERSDKNGRFMDFGDGIKSISFRIDLTFPDAAAVYSMLSPAAHGDVWAVSVLGSETVAGPESMVLLFPYLAPSSAQWIIIMTVEWFARFLWTHHEMFGWDLTNLRSVLENAYDQLCLDSATRFWR